MVETGWTLIKVIVFYMSLAWYFDNVIPSNRGVPKPYYFFLQISFWFPSCKRSNQSQKNASDLLAAFESEKLEKDGSTSEKKDIL